MGKLGQIDHKTSFDRLLNHLNFKSKLKDLTNGLVTINDLDLTWKHETVPSSDGKTY